MQISTNKLPSMTWLLAHLAMTAWPIDDEKQATIVATSSEKIYYFLALLIYHVSNALMWLKTRAKYCNLTKIFLKNTLALYLWKTNQNSHFANFSFKF